MKATKKVNIPKPDYAYLVAACGEGKLQELFSEAIVRLAKKICNEKLDELPKTKLHDREYRRVHIEDWALPNFENIKALTGASDHTIGHEAIKTLL